ncbi:MAG TPA: hypothetical protein PKA21_05270, partial [Kiritimatiellia bacterium]|nr:hypothetical protein [Kiritimatiellia bacterium]
DVISFIIQFMKILKGMAQQAGLFYAPPTDSCLAHAPHDQTPSCHERASGMWCHEQVNQSGMRPA